jgi:hypothetical protein
VAEELRWIASGSGDGTTARRGVSTTRWRMGVLLAGGGLSAGVVLTVLVAFVTGYRYWMSRPSQPTITRTLVGVAPADRLEDFAPVISANATLARTAIALSPDGQTLVFAGIHNRQQQLYLRPIDRLDAVPLPGTESGSNPFFSPDGQWLGFVARGEIKKMAVAGGPPFRICAAPLVTVVGASVPASCSPDGETLVLYEFLPDVDRSRRPGSVQLGAQASRLETISLRSADRRAEPLTDSGFFLSGADVSPDGQWVAYGSDETGAMETYVQPFGRAGRRVQVSFGGGMAPVWRRDGRELFFVVPPKGAEEGRIGVVAVPVATKPEFAAGTPHKLFEAAYPSALLTVARHYDASPDGQRFVFLVEASCRAPGRRRRCCAGRVRSA